MARSLLWRKWVKFKVLDYAGRGLMHGASVLYSKAQERTPIDDGELVTGARVSSEGGTSEHLTVYVSYGNNPVSAEYAIIQHENLSYAHKPGQSAKWLEIAYEDMKDEIPRIVADYVREVIS